MQDWYWIAALLIACPTVVYFVTARLSRQPPKTTSPPKPAVVTESPTGSVPDDLPDSVRRLPLPKLEFEEDEALDPTMAGQQEGGWLSPPTAKIVYDDDAAIDEPT